MEQAILSPRATGPWSSYSTSDLRVTAWRPASASSVSVNTRRVSRAASALRPATDSMPCLQQRNNLYSTALNWKQPPHEIGIILTKIVFRIDNGFLDKFCFV